MLFRESGREGSAGASEVDEDVAVVAVDVADDGTAAGGVSIGALREVSDTIRAYLMCPQRLPAPMA